MRTDLPVSVTLEGSEELKRFLEGVNERLRPSRLRESWQSMLELVLLSVSEHTPSWRGDLVGGLGTDLATDESAITGIVFSDTEYAPFQERGTNPYMPNVEALEDWAADHNISPVYVAQVIALRGIIPLKFFEKGFDAVKAEVVSLVDDVVVSILEEESGALG